MAKIEVKIIIILKKIKICRKLFLKSLAFFEKLCYILYILILIGTKMLALINQLNILDKRLGKMSADMVDYLINNFATPLGLSEVHCENLQHFVDGLMAHRAYFYSLGIWERVDEINYYLDKIAECTHPEGGYIPPHHDEMYRPPVNLDFLERFRDEEHILDGFDMRVESKNEDKYLCECREKDAL